MPTPKPSTWQRNVRRSALLAIAAASAYLNAQTGLRVIDLDFSGLKQTTVVLFERPNRPGEYLIAEEDIPEGVVIPAALAELPRFSEAGCNKCIPVAVLGGIQFNERDASGLLQLHPKLLPAQALTLQRPNIAQSVQRRPGFMMNWGLRAARQDANEGNLSETRHAADAEIIASLGPAGVLRTDGVWLENFGWRRGSSSLEFYSIENRFQVVLGDTISASGPLSSGLRLGGIAIRRRFDTQPGRIFTPAYDLSTVSSLPGVAELYIDGERRRRQNVNAGKVSFEDIQGNNGSNVTLRFIDELGAVQEVSTRLLGLTRMIGRGEWDYGFTAGAQRQSENDYAEPGAALDLRYGVTNWLNMEVFAEGVENQYNSALGLTLALPFAIIDISGSRNYYPQDVDEPQPYEQGEAYTWSITNTAASQFSQFTYGYEGRQSHNFRRLLQADPLEDFQRAFIGTYIGRFGLTAAANRIDDVNTYSGSMSTRLGQFVLSAGASHVESGGSAGFISISWTPGGDRLLRQTSLSYGQSETLDSTALSASFVSAEQRAIADFRAEKVQAIEKPRQSESFGQARIAKHWRPIAASYNYRDDGDLRSQNIRAEGGIAFAGAAPKFVQRINPNDGYLVVDSPLPGVKIDYGGYTHTSDGNGRVALVSRGFSPTRYQVDLNSLPEGYSLSKDLKSTAVVPGTRGVSELEMAAPGFLLTIAESDAGQNLIWNGKVYPIFGIGAYIENASVGTNLLTWQGETFKVEMPPIGSDIPEFEFNPRTGKLLPVKANTSR